MSGQEGTDPQHTKSCDTSGGTCPTNFRTGPPHPYTWVYTTPSSLLSQECIPHHYHQFVDMSLKTYLCLYHYFISQEAARTTADNDCDRQDGHPELVSITLTASLQKWKPVKPSGKREGSHPQPRGFLHMPFFLITAGNLVPKKLAVETEAGDTTRGHLCRSGQGESRGREGTRRSLRHAGGGNQLAGAGIGSPQTREGRGGGDPGRRPL